MGRRQGSRPLRNRALRVVRRQGQAGARHLSRVPVDQRRLRRRPLPGHRDPGSGGPQPPRFEPIREEISPRALRPGNRAREALSESSRGPRQFDSPPGGEPARPRSHRRGAGGSRRHRRGRPLAGSELRHGSAMAPRVHVRAGHGRVVPRWLADPHRVPRRGARAEGTPMTATLTIANPATGGVITRLAADSPREVRAHYDAARKAQPQWAATPLRRRLAAIARFREAVVAESETLARTLTEEVGKPIRQSRNELKGLLARLDFFIAETAKTLRERKVYANAGEHLDERISFEPLGVVANISAWNYPYFVGSNVFVPALAAGNSVLYKPSEFATLSGQHIARLLHGAGIPEDVFVPVIGAGATGATIAAAVAKRMIKLQLELGGKDPVYVCDDVDVVAAAAAVADGAFYNTGQSCCSVERIYVHEAIHDAFVAAFVAEVRRYVVGDPRDETTDIV